MGDRSRGARRRHGAAPVGAAGRRLAVGEVPPRPAAQRRHPARRGPRARHGGVGPARHRAHLADHRGGRAGRGGARGADVPGGSLVGHQPARGHLHDPRRAHARAARGEPALRRPAAHPGGAGAAGRRQRPGRHRLPVRRAGGQPARPGPRRRVSGVSRRPGGRSSARRSGRPARS